MSKAKEETQNLPSVDVAALFTDEEMQELLGLTGQATNFSMDRTPTLKINKYPIKDLKGNSVPMGNFVLGQITKQEGKNTNIEFIGIDCGANPEITVLKFGTKFSYFPETRDKKVICQSQLVLDIGEKHVGDNLGFLCMDGTCFRRGKDVDKKEKCSCQYVAFVEVGEERHKALMYFKGTSFIPFKTYLDSAGKFPLFCYPTKLNTEQQVNGSNVYWIITPELLKDRPYAKERIMDYKSVVKEIDTNVRAFESQRKLQAAAKDNVSRQQLPPGMSIEPSTAGPQLGGNTANPDDDEIVF